MWHDKFSEEKPRGADNRATILARVPSWAAKDGPLRMNVLDGFESAYASDRSGIIWLSEHIEAFRAVASYCWQPYSHPPPDIDAIAGGRPFH